METKDTERIEEANRRKQRACENISAAWSALREAQNQIASVEGMGSSEIYGEIADAYILCSHLRDKLGEMEVTGLFGELED